MTSIGFLVYDITLMGGAERVAISLANTLAEEFQVHLISVFYEKDKPCFPVDSRVNIHQLQNGTGSIPTRLPSLCSGLRRCLKREDIRVLFSITAGVNSVMVGAAAGLDVKTVFCEHSNLENPYYGKKHRFRQWLGARCCYRVVTLTERDRDNFRREFHLPVNRVQCIYNWIGDEWLAKEPVFHTEAHRIVTVGRLTSVKGYDQLVQTAKQVLPRHPEWEWHIYGDGEDRDKIAQDIQNSGLEKQLILKGAHQNMQEIYPEYGLYVLTSYYEGLPLALLEAQACGLPIVAYNCPTGPEEIVIEGVNGRLTPPGDPHQLAQTIEELIEDETLRRQYAEHSRDGIERFSRARILQQWRQMVEDCLPAEK